jgi:hypothetical protein
MQQRIIFVQPFPEVIGDHFKAGPKSPGVELHARFRRDNPVTLIPPCCIGIAHDLAHALIKQQTLDRAKEWKYQIKTHSESLQWRRTGLCGRFLLRILILRTGFLSRVQLEDGIDADLPDAPLKVRIIDC